MKTAREKADELLEKLLYLDLKTEAGIDGAKEFITTAIKEQDRDTRHACSEAVLAVDYEYIDDVTIDHASRACMNVKAV
jgi:hypothetical protein